MSKSSQNKVYYEIGIVNQSDYNMIDELVTRANIIKKEGIVHEKFMNFMYNTYGKDIIVLWNMKNGRIPNDHRSEIKIRIPKEPELKFNK